MEKISDLMVKIYENEDDVREEFITPLLKKLGYKQKSKTDSGDIHRGFSISNPFQLGHQKIQPKKADYVISINEILILVADAKSPNVNPIERKYVEQTFSYAYCPEINADFFIISNAKNTYVFSTDIYFTTRVKISPDLSITISELKDKFPKLNSIVSKEALGKNVEVKILNGVMKKFISYEKNKKARIAIISCTSPKGELLFGIDLFENIFPNGMWFKVYIDNESIIEIGKFELKKEQIISPIFVKIEFSDLVSAETVIDFYNDQILYANKLYAKPYIPEKFENEYNDIYKKYIEDKGGQ